VNSANFGLGTAGEVIMALGRWMLDAFGRIQIEKHWVQIEGHSMHCLKAGAGPELILLHGLLGTASTWELTIPDLAAESTVYAVDALGIGESERVPGIDATPEAQAARLIAFMDESNILSADFLATSHGGAVALTLAAKYPGRVRTLMLHAPANPFSRLTDPLINFYLSGLGTWFAHRVASLPEPMQALALGRMYGDPTHLREGSLGKYIGSLRVPGTVDYVLSMLRTWFDDMVRLETALEHVRPFPVLLLWGDRDRAVSLASAQDLRRCFDRAEFELLPGTGHLPYEECPEVLTRLVNSFLSRMRESGPQLVRNSSRLA
jgi:4,5:9,10-diseco-3-hydroxy-5,9,17-trioxoandrosta-1(10),2-diene-4-oate hydrolase